MLKVVSREYKVILNHPMFAEPEEAIGDFWEELRRFAKPLGVRAKGCFEKTKMRRVVFLDTADQTIRLNQLVFRQRADKRCTEFTLKCRSPDRYFAAEADLVAATGIKSDDKFEEDIAAPFLSRFSHSVTIKSTAGTPKTVGDAASIFPTLGKLRRDRRNCGPATRIMPVNALEVSERVLKGPSLKFSDEVAEVALILWADVADGRPVVGEFSFRYGDKQEHYSGSVARQAMQFFQYIQRLRLVSPFRNDQN